MSASPEPDRAAPRDPLHRVAPREDDVEARRVRASIESRLFSGVAQPVRVGRYRVEGRIGAGGMGVVYRAHDPELARDVAVKLMNAELARTKDPSTARARLVREARAMARLAHPNVIHVYDVGQVEDGVFIAMELVEGRSLARWLADEQPPWREILRKYVEAGRGLAAAHAAGVIHRDFKPENVLLGEDDRVRVVDFGLAGGPAALAATAESELDRDSGDLHGPSGSLTQTGTLLGTPKYMSPEQESGNVADARSDQFSFCVALYEALYGRPPFAGDTVSAYRANVRHGRVLEPPPDSKVRAWVHAVIVRGLAIDPSDRHPGLEPLLDRLEEALVDPNIARRRRRRMRVVATIGGAAVLLLLGGVGLWSTRRDDTAPSLAPALASAAEHRPEPLSRPDAAGPALVATADRPGPPPGPELEPLGPRPEASTGAAEAVADDTDGDAEGPEATDGTGEASPSADTEAAAIPESQKLAKRKRKVDNCYFFEDKLRFLRRSSQRHERFQRSPAGRCMDCERRLADDRRSGLDPADCGRNYQCFATSEDQCAS